MDRPYLRAGAAAVGSALVAGLIVALIDTLLTAGEGAGAGALLLPILALYAVPALAIGVGAGLVAGSIGASFGTRPIGALLDRLRRDRALDRNVIAGIVAAGFVAILLVVLVAAASLVLVAGVERKTVGALLAGAVAAAALPFLVALAMPVYRAARAPAQIVPRIGPLPGSLVLLVAIAGVGLLGAVWFIRGRLDWRALNLGGYLLLGGFGLLVALVAALAYGPLDGVRRRIPARGVVLVVAVAVAVLLPVVALRGQPSAEVAIALGEQSVGARMLVKVGRRLSDGDGDGFSAFLGGPDCDDSRKDVNPDAAEVPGNGVDDNCLGGDRAAADKQSSKPDKAAGGAATPPSAARAESVIIIGIDTLRADRLGVAGYQRNGKSLTPNLDRLAAESAYYTRVYAQAPNTPRSFPSFFMSRYPSQVKVDKEFANYGNPLDDNVSLFEALKAGGVATNGIASHFYFQRAPGILQGFDEFDNEGALDIAGSNKDSAAPRIVPKVEARLAALAAKKDRFALFVHLFEPHSTYMAHDEFPITESGTAALEQKYDFEIAYVDGFVGRILDAIDKNGLRERTLLVVMSDHGEAFGVHRAAGQRMFFHGQTLYDELLRVPLLVRLPGAPPRKIDDPVALVDLAPTVLDALGLAVPQEMVGRSVLGAALGQALAPRPIFAQLLPAPSWDHKWMAMVTAGAGHKIIYKMSDRAFELYDLATDPEEKKNLIESQGELAGRLKEELTRWIEVDLPL